MALNWVEDVVSHLYKLRGYIVLENEDLPMPKGVSGRAEADIIAIKDGELVHVECMSGWWPGKDEGEKKEFQRLRNKFERTHQMFEKYNFLKRLELKITKVFVTSGKAKKPRPNGPWGRLQEFCRKEEIKLIEINSIIEDLIKELRNRFPKRKQIIEKHKGIARFLIHLIHNDFLKM